jgi:hypothetical protein
MAVHQFTARVTLSLSFLVTMVTRACVESIDKLCSADNAGGCHGLAHSLPEGREEKVLPCQLCQALGFCLVCSAYTCIENCINCRSVKAY